MRVIYGDSPDTYPPYPASANTEFDAAMENLSDEIPWEVMSSKSCYYLVIAARSPMKMSESERVLYDFIKQNPGRKSGDIAEAMGGTKTATNVYGMLQCLKARLKEIGTERVANSHKGYRIVAL